MADLAIDIQNISKEYRIGESSDDLRETLSGILKRRKKTSFLALDDISLQIEKGEVLGIIGHNGAGKSTLLKILSKITAPTKGRVIVDGKLSSLLEVGTGFHPELTGRENIFLNGAILGMKHREIVQRFDQIVEFSGVSQFLETPVKHYSSGMYVRLAFAVAAHLETEILVVDEVLAVGDAEFQNKCLGKMKDVASGGRTVLFVSHSMTAISSLCQKVALLNSGKLQQLGEPADMIELYLNTSAQDGQTDFANYKHRAGNQSVKITGVRLVESNSGSELPSVVAGQDVTFEIAYASETDAVIKDFNLGLAVFSKDLDFKVVLNSNMSSKKFKNLPSRGKVYCQLDKLPLMYGKFYVTLTLQTDFELSDQLSHAFSFFVERGDYYGTGMDNVGSRQGVYVDQRWYAENEK